MKRYEKFLAVFFTLLIMVANIHTATAHKPSKMVLPADLSFTHDYPYYPNPKLTTGVADPKATDTLVCKDGYTAKVRNVSEALKKQVFKEYGITKNFGDYEIDHFISLELGGTNDIGNLWPQPYKINFGARQKDVVETELHREICSGKKTLAEAQKIITTDWIDYYFKLKGLTPTAKSGK